MAGDVGHGKMDREIRPTPSPKLKTPPLTAA